MLNMQFKMTDGQPKKKRKLGGSFCAVGGRSKNSYRDLESAIDGRGFLKFYRLPKEPETTQMVNGQQGRSEERR